jgi:hypothetical protein
MSGIDLGGEHPSLSASTERRPTVRKILIVDRCQATFMVEENEIESAGLERF